MAEASHTVAPWIAREGISTGMEVVAKKPRGGDYVVARCGGKDREANARLIAAAPDMLAALKEATERLHRAVLGGGTDIELADLAVAKYRDAIAKAEGRS